jgi:hypothetical protein
MHELASLPRPNAQIATSVTRDDEFSFAGDARKRDVNGISGGFMAPKALLFIPPESIAAAVTII